MDLLTSLNPMQREGVMQIEGPVLLLAGAGSGKTKALTHRIAYMIEQNIDPFNILAVTFTNKAAKEMKERAESLTSLGGSVWISTFHSTCVRILRREIEQIGFDRNFTIYDASDAEKLIKDCMKIIDLNDKQFPAKNVMYEISAQKNELVTPIEYQRAAQRESDYRKVKISEVYSLYQKRLRENNALDFDDIIFKTVELFVAHPTILERYQNRFVYIMIDEYQDTNGAQYRLIRLLADKYENLCVVGDDDQSIYGWRGANIKNILNFEKDFPQAKVIKLEQNYRSTNVILDSANAVIRNNTKRKDKALWTDAVGGSKIEYKRAENDYAESKFVVGKIEEEVDKGAGYKDFAVLYRTNAQSRLLEEQLILKNIPHKIFGGVRFYERKEIKDILAYLRILHNQADDVAFRRIINVPKRGIGDTTVDRIFDYAREQEMPFFQALMEVNSIEGIGNRKGRIVAFADLIADLITFSKSNSIVKVMEELFEKSGYIKELEAEATEESRSRIENIQDLLAKAIEFEEHAEEKTISAFLEDVALVADIDNYAEDDNAVVLMTLHSSKGLEFPTVFIVGFEEGIFPSYRAVISKVFDDLEEERRLCYVGITRAKQKLFITSAVQRRQHGHLVYNAASRFLDEIPKHLLESVKTPLASSKPEPIQPNIGKPKITLLNSYLEEEKHQPDGAIDFTVGDQVRQMKYGVGVVQNIQPAGKDFEVTIAFPAGVKKLMAHLSKLKKV